jgi:preprotein translocase subunit SecE
MSDANALHERKHVWRDEILLIVSLIVFVGIVYTLDGTLQPAFTSSTFY